MKKFLFIISVLVNVFVCSAQTGPVDLPEETQQEVKDQAKQKVNAFNDHISFIATKRNPLGELIPEAAKDDHISSALRLFIGGGEISYDEDGNKIPAPQMEVSSINRNKEVTTSRMAIKKYLRRVKAFSYSEVKVTASNACFVGDMKQVGTNKFETVLTYVQIFEGKRVNRYNESYVAYRDVTKKSVRVHIYRKTYGDIVRWDILLGDIWVTATTLD